MRLAQEARRITGQHAYLDALERTTTRAFERDDAAAMAEAFRGFAGSLEAHFHLEEQVHFPALHGLDGGLATDLSKLVRDHERFREQIDGLRAQIEAGEPTTHRGQILSAFRALTAALSEHEASEESLLARAHAPA